MLETERKFDYMVSWLELYDNSEIWSMDRPLSGYFPSHCRRWILDSENWNENFYTLSSILATSEVFLLNESV